MMPHHGKDRQPFTVFLTGASSGIGAALAEAFLQEGCEVWGTSRDTKKLARFTGLHPIAMHLEDSASVKLAWAEALEQSGGFDLVIQNAGAGIFGSIEEVSEEDARWLWSVVVEGPLLVLKLAAAHMRPKRSGMIVGISSLAAEMPMCFSAHYSAGKAAFSALMEGLWMELKPFGVRVLEIRPGDIRTPFNQELRKADARPEAYQAWSKSAWEATQQMIQTAPGPQQVAKKVMRLVRQKNPPFLTCEGSFYQSVIGHLGVRVLPREILLKQIRSAYGLDKIDSRAESA
jgi:NAD(P)-dependent dehydrogenase (short-subunit alcohol dehydrogenase family)